MSENKLTMKENGLGSRRNSSSAFTKPGRMLNVTHSSLELSIYIPLEFWVDAEVLRDRFQHTEGSLIFDEELEADQFGELFLYVNFLHFCYNVVQDDTDNWTLLKFFYDDFCYAFLNQNDVHVLASKLPQSLQSIVVKYYYEVHSALYSHFKSSTKNTAAIFSHSKVSSFALFGGQGSSDYYFEELIQLVDTYGILINEYFTEISKALLEVSSSEKVKRIVPAAIDLVRWVHIKNMQPTEEYLLSTPVSLPVLGVIQLLHYYVMCKVLDITPDEAVKHFKGMTGHSQGIIPACVASLAGSDSEFIENSKKAVCLLFWIGTRCAQVFPFVTLNPKVLSDSLKFNEGTPTPMLLILNLSAKEVKKYVDIANSYLPEDRKIFISLYNGPRSIVCSGPSLSLYGLNVSLRKIKCPPNVDQNRIPHSNRKLNFTTRFLPITVPFHSGYLQAALELIEDDIKQHKLTFEGRKLKVPVFSTFNGENMMESKNLTKDLVSQICIQPVYWENATKMESITHMIDFGPGLASGIGNLTQKNKDGAGVQIIVAGIFHSPVSSLKDKSVLFNRAQDSVTVLQDWKTLYAPKLIRDRSGDLFVSTKFSEFIGKPPLMVAGMTPTTVNSKFVSACINAGYHVELAGGGHFTDRMLIDEINDIISRIPAGEGITLNALFLNARLWAFQYPLVKRLRQEGIPIYGLTVAAGVPSLELANEVVESLRDAGLKHISFKPGSKESIYQVLSIARHNPKMPIILQWTGGRAGGHHSFEDFHQPILDTYSAIRSEPNIILVGGSGFGDAEGVYPYLTGSWSRKFNCPEMPFDAILFGSRVMIAEEGLASDSIKQVIADAPGIEEEIEWEKSYKEAIGGVITVNSELGEPIHKIATRGVLLWKEFDDTIFSLPKDKRVLYIAKKKEYIIKRLNEDAQKVWFGMKKNGKPVDVHEMTYSEVNYRLVDLLFIKSTQKWIDPSYLKMVTNFLQRVEQRFIAKNMMSILELSDLESNPMSVLETFDSKYKESTEALLNSEDVLYFMEMCKTRIQKPVPFIPILDDNFEFWFKKDSLWQSENVDAVRDQDPHRVCILHGPAAAKYSTKVEPVGKILDDIHSGLCERILRDTYKGNLKSVNSLPPLSPVSSSIPEMVTKFIATEKDACRINWKKKLVGERHDWFRELLLGESILQGKSLVHNSISSLFNPNPGQEVVLNFAGEHLFEVSIFDSSVISSDSVPSHTVHLKISEGLIILDLNYDRNGEIFTLQLMYKYCPQVKFAQIQEVMRGRNERIKEFYWRIWCDKDCTDFRNVLESDDINMEHVTETYIDRFDISKFCGIVNNHAAPYVDLGQNPLIAPMDYAIVVCWQSVIKAIFPKYADCDLLKLVHLSNEITVLKPDSPFADGDEIRAVGKLVSIRNGSSGKTISVCSVASRHGVEIIQVVSKFLYRGTFHDSEYTFEKKNEIPVQVVIKTSAELAAFEKKNWIKSKEKLRIGAVLVFRLSSHYCFDVNGNYSRIETKGSVNVQISTKEFVHIADVDYLCEKLSVRNPVLLYLEKFGTPIEQPVYFESGGYSMNYDYPEKDFMTTTNMTNHDYSQISGDFNPIHTNPYFAAFAQLPGTITHGMWTSASIRAVVEKYSTDYHPLRLTKYEVDFVGMVLPNEKLYTKMTHVGMTRGRKIIKIETLNEKEDIVLTGVAEVQNPTTAYVFTGQGSQEQGMGMELYESSPVARELWDRADRHFKKLYGLSILEIVRDNPKTKTVYFGGPTGAKIHQNYLNLTYETMINGEIVVKRLFPSISEDSSSYTFVSPNGLLSATQFTQPALTLMEKAAFEDMRSKGLISENCSFAGHSLGEYAGLAAVADVLSVETIVDVVFYRGMTMQLAVNRSKTGKSNYGMSAVNPVRVNRSFEHTALEFVVQAIAKISKRLLEIVNYNVENWQYVVAGHLVPLQILTNVLNFIHKSNYIISDVLRQKTIEQVQEEMEALVAKECLLVQKEFDSDPESFTLQRGQATIPIPGIDVPFHSSYLLEGVGPMRTVLSKKILLESIDVNQLVGKYIPNLLAIPFSLSKEFVTKVAKISKGVKLHKILKNWDDSPPTTPAELQSLAHVLVIELLSYQFASPVQWIGTQDQLFKNLAVERLVEIGPAPILANMAGRTLKIKYEAYDDALNFKRDVLALSRNQKELYFNFHEDIVQEEPSKIEKVDLVKPFVEATPVQTPELTSTDAVGPSTAETPELPFSVEDLILVLLSIKLKKQLKDISAAKTIKEMVSGKSTLQNEILGDLQKEFGDNVPEKSEDTPISEIAVSLQNAHSGVPGKHTLSLINKLIADKMPAGFGMNAVKEYLLKRYGLSDSSSIVTLCFALSFQVSNRFATETEAKAWLDTVAKFAFDRYDIPVPSPTKASIGGSTSVVSSEALTAFENKHKAFVKQQIELYAQYLGTDLNEHLASFENATELNADLQSRLDVWENEHGDFYSSAIKPMFDTVKIREYDSYWNWVRQDILQLYYDIMFGRLTKVDREVTARCIHVMNRCSNATLEMLDYMVKHSPESQKDSEEHETLRRFGESLINNCREVLSCYPVYKNVDYPKGPKTEITENGKIVYEEINRENIFKFSSYVQEMKQGIQCNKERKRTRVLYDINTLYKVLQAKSRKRWKKRTKAKQLLKQICSSILPEYKNPSSVLHGRVECSQKPDEQPDHLPFIFLKRKGKMDETIWEYSSQFTDTYFESLAEIAQKGLTFGNKCVLMTGCGKGSIGAEVLRGLLNGGATVVVTTSSFNRNTTEYFRSIYESHGSKASRLIVVPFNQGSKTDVIRLIDYIYDSKKGLGLDLDFIVPFAAISENGRDISELDSKSEFAHRLMLTNLLRLLGAVVTQKKANKFDTRPAQVMLPLSPNHGTFGGDGLYGESKLALETCFNRWQSENWQDYLTITGAVIGWTRGTGLMSENNIIAQEIEKLGARTFSSSEMAFNIIGLMHPKIVKLNQTEPIYADLNGGLQNLANLNSLLTAIRNQIQQTVEIKSTLFAESQREESCLVKVKEEERSIVQKRSNIKVDYPVLPDYHELQKLTDLSSLLDLDQVVVVTGYGEVSPYGNSRTRWEMEANGTFSMEGCIEMAWIMGLIKYKSGLDKNGDPECTWVDAKTGDTVADHEIFKYEDQIMEHTGIRLIEPELFDGYNPHKKRFFREIVVEKDMNLFEASEEDAEGFKRQHGDKVEVTRINEQTFVRFKKGAIIYVPKALKFDRFVAGQIPTGFDASRYGVPPEIIDQVDPVTVFVLISTVEALVSAGITDPYEFYEYVHVSEVGNTSGGGVGGFRTNRKIFLDRLLERPVQSDILQESFINTMPAWVNLLLLSSSGPIKTPVGACATAVESVDIGVETIKSGKAKVVVVGGYDDFQEEGSYEFASMKATSNSQEEVEMGREPKEMCRPTTSTRGGFMEAQGAGIQILMTASLAIKLGCPIYGVIAGTNTATDKEGRSVPAPGQGILTTAKQVKNTFSPRTLSAQYRHRQLQLELKNITKWLNDELTLLQMEVSGDEDREEVYRFRLHELELEASRKTASAKRIWGSDFYASDPRISPLAGCLAVFDLTIDDIGVASFHGTGTKANDVNESRVVDQQLRHLGRKKGNVVPCVFQKYLTGHPKGAAAAWMMNGMLQIMQTAIIPGNRNADNIDREMQEFDYLVYPSKSIQTLEVKAGILKSFGFGQVGGEVVVVHPKYVLSTLTEKQFNEYKKKRQVRYAQTNKATYEALTGVSNYVKVKTSPPYSEQLESKVYLNPLARASFDKTENTWKFTEKSVTSEAKTEGLLKKVSESSSGLGVDIQLISEVSLDPVFLSRNFTASEIEYCSTHVDPQSSFSGKWAAKEAVFKAICHRIGKNISHGEGAPLLDIEIVNKDKMPFVVLHGELEKYHFNGKNFSVSISHSGEYAMAIAKFIEQ